MKKLALLVTVCSLLASCFTTEEDRKSLEAVSTENIEMDTPESIDAATAQKPAASNPVPMVIVADGVKAHSKASSSSKILKSLEKWQDVSVTKTSGDWSYLEGLGWVKSEYLGE